MRVISQSGRFDLPYEQIYVYRNDDDVECRMCGNKDNWVLLGHYSSPEKAEKAMEMCRSKYLGRYEVDGFKLVSGKIKPEVFQFPADNDVEVENANT